MTQALVQCPDYLDEMPILLAETGPDGLPVVPSQDASRVLGQFSSREIETMMRKRRRRNNESARDYAERIAKYLSRDREKDQRRENRKKIWVERLFGGE